jgi:hypothetical protein
LNIDGCIKDLFPRRQPPSNAVRWFVEKKDTVGVHHGLSVVLLSNAYTSRVATCVLSAKIAEFAGRFPYPASYWRFNQTEGLAAKNLCVRASNPRDAQFIVKNAALKSGQVFGRYRQNVGRFLPPG